MNYFAPSIALVGGNVLLLVRLGVFYNLVYNITVLKLVFFHFFFHFHYCLKIFSYNVSSVSVGVFINNNIDPVDSNKSCAPN